MPFTPPSDPHKYSFDQYRESAIDKFSEQRMQDISAKNLDAYKAKQQEKPPSVPHVDTTPIDREIAGAMAMMQRVQPSFKMERLEAPVQETVNPHTRAIPPKPPIWNGFEMGGQSYNTRAIDICNDDGDIETVNFLVT